MDKLIVTVLDDGNFKIETGKVSAANHGGAELLLRTLRDMSGGPATRQRHEFKGGIHVTEAAHDHEHGHSH